MSATTKNKLEVARDILRVSGRKTSSSLPHEILSILAASFNLRAAIFYSFTDLGVADSLALRAQIGLEYSKFKSYLLHQDSEAAKSIETRTQIAVSNLSKSQDENENFLSKTFGIQACLYVPLFVDKLGHANRLDDDNSGRLGVLCLYPGNPAELRSLRTTFHHLGPVISEVYVQSIDVDKLKFREQVTTRAIASADVNSFLHRVCRLLKEEWNYEAVSIYVYDERADILRLGATTGLKVKGQKTTIHVAVDGSGEFEAECFRERQTFVYMIGEGKDPANERIEAVSGTVLTRMFVPIPEPTNGGSIQNVVGVARVTNKLLKHDGRPEVVSFGWEDISFIRFACDVFGVIVSLFGRVSKSKEDFERSLHGVQNNLNGVLGSLDFIKAQLARSDELRQYAYLLPTAHAQLEALAWQIERFARRDRNQESQEAKAFLLSDVFAKLGPLIRSLATSFNTKIESLPSFNEIFNSTPPIAIAPNELLVVFRNMFENSVKYSDPNRPLKIDLLASISANGKVVVIKYSDNGIGISQRDAARVFHEGFRSEDAMRRCTTGAGLGLFQCREILSLKSGSIELSKFGSPTEFTITLPIWSSSDLHS